MDNCIFCKIVVGEIPAKKIYEDEFVISFPDIHPVAPIHILTIPKKHIKEFFEVENHEIFMHIGCAIQKLIEQFGLDKNGYKIEVNGGGTQDVDHLHFHLMGPHEKNQK